MEALCHQIPNAVWFQTHRVSDLKRGRLARLRAPFFARPRSGAAGSDGSAINPPVFPIEQTLLIEGGTQGDQQTGKAPLLTPAAIPIVRCAVSKRGH